MKDSPDYKKGKKAQKNLKKAKKQVKQQKLDLSKNADLIIAAGIIVTCVGFAICAPELIPFVLAAA